MASYSDIRSILFSDDALKNRVDVATMIAANNLLSGSPTADQQKWAASVFNNPRGEGQKAFRAVIATHNALPIATIQNSTDATLQTAVDAVVPSLIIAFNAA